LQRGRRQSSDLLRLALPLMLLTSLACMQTDWGDWSLLSGKNNARGSRPDPETLPEAPPPKINAETHIASGVMLEKQGDLLGAKKQYQKALELKPKSLDATNRLGKACCQLEQYDEAAAAFRRALDLDPGSAAVRNNLGYNLMAQSELAEAEQQFRAALRIDPDFERARVNLGVVLAKQQRLADATTEFLKVLPRHTAYYNVGIICLEAGQTGKARSAFQQALAIKPDFQPARKQLAGMQTRSSVAGAAVSKQSKPAPRAGSKQR